MGGGKEGGREGGRGRKEKRKRIQLLILPRKSEREGGEEWERGRGGGRRRGGEEGEKVWSVSPLARSGFPPRVSSRRGERGARGGGEGGVWDEASHRLVTGMPISAATPKTCLGNVFIYKVNFSSLSLSHTLSLSFSLF